jgi:hypothetical protein
MLFAAVEVGKLLEVAAVSLASGVAVTMLFSFVVLAGGKSAEARRSGSPSGALGYAALAIACFLAFFAVVVLGVQIMLSKG